MEQPTRWWVHTSLKLTFASTHDVQFPKLLQQSFIDNKQLNESRDGFQPSGQGGWACHHGGKGYKQQHDDDGKGGKGAVGSPPTMTQVVARAKTMAFSPVAKAKVIIMHIAVMPAIIVMLRAARKRNRECHLGIFQATIVEALEIVELDSVATPCSTTQTIQRKT